MRNLRPERVFIFANNPPIQDDSPGLLLGRREAQALERDCDPRHKALRSQPALRIPQGIERRVEVSTDLFVGRLTPDRVPLDAQRIDLEGVCAPSIVKRIQHHLDRVIFTHIFAACRVRAYFATLIEADEHDVEVLGVVSQVGLGRFRDRFSVMRIALGETGHLRHLHRHVARRLHGEKVVYGRPAGTDSWVVGMLGCWDVGMFPPTGRAADIPTS